MLIINTNRYTAITGNYQNIPSEVGDNLPEITGLPYGPYAKTLIISNLKN